MARVKEKNVRLWMVAIECDILEDAAIRKGAAGFLRLGYTEVNRGDGSVLLAQAARP